MKNRRVRVQGRVDETDGRFASLKPLVVDAGQDRRKRWRAGGGTANQGWGAVVEDDNVVSDCRDVWISASDAVVLASICTDILPVRGAVILVLRLGGGEVGCNGTLLIPSTQSQNSL